MLLRSVWLHVRPVAACLPACLPVGLQAAAAMVNMAAALFATRRFEQSKQAYEQVRGWRVCWRGWCGTLPFASSCLALAACLPLLLTLSDSLSTLLTTSYRPWRSLS